MICSATQWCVNHFQFTNKRWGWGRESTRRGEWQCFIRLWAPGSSKAQRLPSGGVQDPTVVHSLVSAQAGSRGSVSAAVICSTAVPHSLGQLALPLALGENKLKGTPLPDQPPFGAEVRRWILTMSWGALSWELEEKWGRKGPGRTLAGRVAEDATRGHGALKVPQEKAAGCRGCTMGTC